LNSDLGEGEPGKTTRALLARVDLANVACGGHAGDVDTLRQVLTWCGELGVRAGAHPGAPDRAGFGRSATGARPRPEVGVEPHHVKLHGTWYHWTDQDAGLAGAYVDWVREHCPQWVVVVRSGGLTGAMARAAGLPVWEEVFLDRGYRSDGTLVPRGEPGAMLETEEEVRERWVGLCEGWVVRTVEGVELRLRADTACVHGDGNGEWVVSLLKALTLGR
jgi:5-oxoprolinase (ATP-hydrolysing) subunit A